MKVITRSVIDIKTGKVLKQDSYEYEGPIAKCFGSSGGDVTYAQSPQQAAMYELLWPMLSKMSSFATGMPWQKNMPSSQDGGQNNGQSNGMPTNETWSDKDATPDEWGGNWDGTGGPDWDPGEYPEGDYPAFSYSSAYSSASGGQGGQGNTYTDENGNEYVTSLWDIPEMPKYPDMPEMYQVPDLYTYNNLPPELKEAMMAPYRDTEKQMLETFGSRGAAGSMGAGYGGSAGAAGGKFWSDAANQMQMQGYQMGQPLWQGQLEANKMGYMGELQKAQGEYGQAMQGWQSQLQENMFPWTAMPGMMGGTYGDAVVSPTQPSQMSQMMPYIMMAMMMSDIRLKKNIKKIGTYKGLDVIEFEYIWGGPRREGLIAQQVQKIMPEAVGSIGGYLYINYSMV
jgi:hypothetical protein